MRTTILTLLIFLAKSSVVVAATMTFTIGWQGNCCEWISGEGEITDRTPADFRAFVKGRQTETAVFSKSAHGTVPNTIFLASTGGSLMAAMELGRMIRKLGLTTIVGVSRPYPNSRENTTVAGDCLSACVFAYAGGVYRYYQDPGLEGHYYYNVPGSRLGIHQASFKSEMAIIKSPAAQDIAASLGVQVGQLITSIEIAYMVEMGIDPAVIGIAASIPAKGMHFLTEEEAVRFKLAMQFDRKPQWSLKPYRQGIMLIGDGIYETQNYQASLWCSDQKTGEMVLSMMVTMVPQDPEPQTRAESAADYRYSLEFKGTTPSDREDVATSDARVIPSMRQVTVDVAIPPRAIQLIVNGLPFRLHSDAPRGDDFWPYAYISVQPSYLPLLRRACAG